MLQKIRYMLYLVICVTGPGKSRRHRKIKSSSAVQTKGIPLSSGTISSRADEQGVDNETPNEGGRGGEEDEEESGQKQLEKAGAYYDKLYFETSSSGEEDGEGEREEQRGGSKVCTMNTVVFSKQTQLCQCEAVSRSLYAHVYSLGHLNNSHYDDR